MDRGIFITIEGIEGSGKSTLAAGIRLAFADQFQVILTREPGGTDVGAQIRKILLSPENTALTPETELLLFAADRTQHVAEKIKPAIAAGAIVVCDRFIHSTLAYQGYGRGLDLELLKDLNQSATAGLLPDLVVLLDLDAEKGLKRVRMRAAAAGTSSGPDGGSDRIEQQSIDFHSRVRNGFLELAKQSQSPFLVLDAARGPEILAAAAVERISQIVEARGVKP